MFHSKVDQNEDFVIPSHHKSGSISSFLQTSRCWILLPGRNTSHIAIACDFVAIDGQLLVSGSYEAVIGHFPLIGAILKYVSEMPRRDEILPEDLFASKLMRANFNIFIIGPRSDVIK